MKRHSTRRCTIAIAAMIVAAVAGCTDSGSESESSAARTASEASRSSTSTAAPGQAGATSARGQAGITDGTLDPSPTQPGIALPVQPEISSPVAASAGDTCGTVIPHATGAVQPVIVLTGSIECATALAVSERYLNDASVASEGQGRFATIDGWHCNWPYVDGRSHAESYLQCTDVAQNSFQIGE